MEFLFYLRLLNFIYFLIIITRFFLTSCSQLTTLLLDCCSYVDEHVLDVISSNCSNLSHLSLSSCREIVSNGFETIKSLKNLTNLNLYRTKIDQKSIIGIVKSCHELKVLNLGSCVNINDFDSLMEEIHKQAIQLESLDMWRAYSLTNLGMNVLAATSCCLQEIDIGWWYVQVFFRVLLIDKYPILVYLLIIFKAVMLNHSNGLRH
jgi:F-box/leucine-rich repeat protein 4